MTTILIGFLLALAFSIGLTPLARVIGCRFGGLDLPDERKVHSKPIPRTGGLAIFIAFWCSIGALRMVPTTISQLLVFDRLAMFSSFGAGIVFGVGLYDDFHRLPAATKLIFQVIGASFAFAGGLRIDIEVLSSPVLSFSLSWLMTTVWFCLLINAVNLIDGLDGLAAGVVFFSSLVMLILSVLAQRYLQAVLLAGFTGAILGFLVFNFHPACIFMGDGGSYFLGYGIAALSMYDVSTKTQLGAAMLIALVSLGHPVFEALLSPLRRFLRGNDPFKPDRRHIHHRLLRLGFDAPKAVMLLYGMSVLLCVTAVLLVHLADKQAGLILVLVGSVSLILFRKLGYFDFVRRRDVAGWLRDIGEELGVSRERRRFLDLQIDIGRSRTIEEMWNHVCRVMEWLEFDFAEAKIVDPNSGLYEKKGCQSPSPCRMAPQWSDATAQMQPSHTAVRVFQWQRNGFDRYQRLCEPCLLKTELPLMDQDTGKNLGTLWLVKDLKAAPVSHYTLKRMEHLRRSMVHRIAAFYHESVV